MSEPLEFKKRLAESFSKNAAAYDARAGLQFIVAALCRERLEKSLRPGFRLLDVGCGTGLLSLPLDANGLRIHAVDMAPGMVARFKQKAAGRPEIHSVLGDGEFLPYRDETFDLVISSLTYHWIWNLADAFREAHRVLKRGGAISIALSGRDSLIELKAATTEALGEAGGSLPPLVAFPGADEVRSAIRASGFSEAIVESRHIVRTYSDFWDFLRALKAIGAGNPHRSRMNSLFAKSQLDAVRRKYHEKYAEGAEIRATYEVLFCSAVKPSGDPARESTR